MTELVLKSAKGNPVTSSLIIAETFDKEHKHVLQSIENLMAENSAAKFFHKTSYESRGKQYPMYIMTRDGFSLLVMGFTGEKALKFKIAFIEAFNKMEAQIKQMTPSVPLSFAEALELAAKQARELDEKNRVIALQAPKVDFADRVIDSGNLVDIGQAAKLLKLPYGRNTLFKVLRDKGVFFKNRNEPKQEYIERGYFELRETEISRENHPPMMVTKILVKQTGLYWMSKTFGGSFESSLPALNAQ